MASGARPRGFPLVLLARFTSLLVLLAANAAVAGAPIPAPPLSDPDIDRLRQVLAWDIVYTHSFSESAAGSGDLTGVAIPIGFTYGAPSAWNASYARQYSFTAKFTVAAQSGPAPCGTTNASFASACPARYEYPATWSASDTLSSYTGYATNFCEEEYPGAMFSTAEAYSSGGSRIMTGVGTGSVILGVFFIDYSVNPPVVQSSQRAEPFPANFTRDFEFDCFPLGDNVFPYAELYTLAMAPYSPFDPPTMPGGDTQIRLENGRFVIRGGIDWDFDQNYRPRGSPQVPETTHVGHQSVHARWIVREHEPAELEITGVRFEQKSIPELIWQPVPQEGTIAGNEVRVITSVHNNGGSDATAILELNDPVSGEIFVVDSADVGAGTTRDFEYVFDSSDAAWEADGSARFVQAFGFELSLGSSVQDVAIHNLTVRPRPLILVHGLVSNAATWSQYQGFLSLVRGDWRAFAVGDGQATGAMNTGSLANPLLATNTIGQNAAVLHAYVEDVRDQLEAHHVDIVGHSMGGLISRFYIQELMPESADASPVVRHLVTLGTPHRGSPCAELILVPAPAIGQLRPDFLERWNTQVTELDGVEPHGLVGIVLPATCQSLEAGDGVVPRSSATFFSDTQERDPLDHLAMTKNAALFESFVKPQLDGSAATPANAQAASAATTGGSPATPPGPQLITSQVVVVPPQQTVDVPIDGEDASRIGVTLMAAPAVASTLLDPTGAPTSVFAAGSVEAQQPLRSHAADSPAVGLWTLRLENTGTVPVTVPISAWVLGSALVLDLVVGTPAADGNTQLLAMFTSAGSAVVGGQVSAHVEGLGDLELFDDGAHADGAANDGSYAVETGALSPGLYPVLATGTASAGTRVTTGLVDTQDPLFIPEPQTLGAALVALAMLARRRRRTQSRLAVDARDTRLVARQ